MVTTDAWKRIKKHLLKEGSLRVVYPNTYEMPRHLMTEKLEICPPIENTRKACADTAAQAAADELSKSLAC